METEKTASKAATTPAAESVDKSKRKFEILRRPVAANPIDPSQVLKNVRVRKIDGKTRRVVLCWCCLGPWHGSARAD